MKPDTVLPETKVCARCLDRKPLEGFGDNPRMKHGKKSYCKPCNADLARIWRLDPARDSAKSPAQG